VTSFGKCSDYYDLIYSQKDYRAEVSCLIELIRTYSGRHVKSILDLGCGTGGHAFLLAERGYEVTGVDKSDSMLAIAREKGEGSQAQLEFINGDIRNVRLERKFDAVISMFAVMGYQTTNDDFERTLRNSSKYLKKNGLLVFDVWFGPAVIAQKPTDRMLSIDHYGDKIIRFSHPELDIMHHRVVVHYTILRIKKDMCVDCVNEEHVMRFFFPLELEYFLQTTGYRLLAIVPFMEKERTPTECDWNVTVIARRS